MFGSIVQHMVFGIVTGSILLLATVGFSMTYMVKRFLNINHAELLTVGAFSTYLFNSIFHFNFILSVLISVILVAFLGVFIGNVFYKSVERFGSLNLLFTSVGIAFIVHGITEIIAGPKIITYVIPNFKAIKARGVPLINLTEIIVIVIAILSIFFLRLFLNQTKNGKAFRAMSFNVELAMVRGIDTNFMSNIIWFIASGLAGLSGVLLGLTAFVSSDMGWNQSLIIMSAAIFGGIGSIYGVMIGSLVMGLAMELGVMVLPSGYKPAIAFLIIIIMLFIKPEGVFRGGQ